MKYADQLKQLNDIVSKKRLGSKDRTRLEKNLFVAMKKLTGKKYTHLLKRGVSLKFLLVLLYPTIAISKLSVAISLLPLSNHVIEAYGLLDFPVLGKLTMYAIHTAIMYIGRHRTNGGTVMPGKL